MGWPKNKINFCMRHISMNINPIPKDKKYRKDGHCRAGLIVMPLRRNSGNTIKINDISKAIIRIIMMTKYPAPA